MRRYCKNSRCGTPFNDGTKRLLCPSCRVMVSRGMVAGMVLALGIIAVFLVLKSLLLR